MGGEGGEKTKGQGGVAGRKRMMGIDSEYKSTSMKRAEQSKAKQRQQDGGSR